MSIPLMKAAIKSAYCSNGKPNKWTKRVDNMSDRQVLAVYRSFLDRRLIA